MPEEKNEQISPPNEPEYIVNQLTQLSLEDQLKLIEEQLKKDQAAQGNQLPEGPQEPPAVVVLKEIAEDTKEVKAISVEPSVIPDGAIYLNPLSIIPTASGYNSLSMELSSKIFNQQARVDRELKEKGVSDNIDFVRNNVKVRIDGVETSNSYTFLEPGGSTSLTQPWIIRLAIPKGLTPGYHTVEVYMVNSWYLAPNILVTLPRADEKVLELGLSTTPPLVTKLPGNQGYKVVLKGKNLIKPFTVSLDNTVLDDTAVAVNGTEELILTIPANIPPPSKGPAYDVTITKDGQKVFTPSFLILGSGPKPPL